MKATTNYHMFALISDGYHPWDKFFIYHCDAVTMDYNVVEMTLVTFTCKRLHKIYLKMKIVL